MKQPVNRSRRSTAAFIVIGVTLLVSIALVTFGFESPMAGRLMDGLLAIAGMTMVTYMGASSVDYTFGKRSSPPPARRSAKTGIKPQG